VHPIDTRDVAGRLLNGRAGDPLLDLLVWLLCSDHLRPLLFRGARRWLASYLQGRDADPATTPRINDEHLLTALAILDTVDRLIARGSLSPHLLRVIGGLWGRALTVPPEAKPAASRFREEYGCEPPWFIAVSPGRACNLRCPGCYSSSNGSQARLPWSMLDRIITEAEELWGINLVVISGGEPLAYRSEGKDIIDLVEKHAGMLFLMFTNGTLIDGSMARRLERTGNLTPALSVEGLRERTDEARGRGIFDVIVKAMRVLGEAGVPIGISATATRHNSEELLSDPFIDLFFDELGVFYGFLFQYMPMGRSCNPERMPTPAQRMQLWRRSWEIVETRKVFLFDFWNHGTMVHGCVAAGRERGYMHVDWNGKVMPCVFAPYSAGNILEIYERGGTLNDIWEAPFFRAIRDWQREYGYGDDGIRSTANWLAPCPVRDHHQEFKALIDEYQPEPQDQSSGLCFPGGGLYDNLLRYGEEMRELSGHIWESEYLARMRGRPGRIASGTGRDRP
jgi:MoaA/NifB/PqqE/SkfB family radical SAM enzyme